MQDQDQITDHGLPWPESYRGILPEIHGKWGIDGEILLSRQLSGGKSGALVFAADIESAGFTGQAILKLDSAGDSAHQEALEASLHRQAIDDAPEFAGRHLPKIINALHAGDQFALLSTIAGRGLEYAEPWPACAYDQQLSIIGRLSRELLEDWNHDYRLNSGMRMPHQLVQAWLGHRMIPEQGGRIHSFLADLCKLSPDEPSITFEGHWYPNPLAFACAVRELPERTRMRAVKGHIHGDMHGLNLLVSPALSQEPNYYIIDLADYQSQQYLLFDHAYFELAYLLTARANASPASFETLLARLSYFDHVGDRRGLQADDLGLIGIVEALRQEVKDWTDRHEADRLSYMESQFILARVAAGLNFAHKRVSEDMRRMAFIYAAFSLKDYLKLNKVDWPKHGPPFAMRGGDDASPTVAAATDVPLASIKQSAKDEQPATVASVDHPEASAVSVDPGQLNRRRMYTFAGLYVIAAFLFYQAFEALRGPVGLPLWTDWLVAACLAVGFPFACLFSWRSAGGRFRSGADAEERGRGLREFLLVASIVAIVVVLAGQFLLDDFESDEPPVSTSAPLRQSIAVLPFRNLSPYDDDDTFSDGLTIEIISTLTRTGEFRVTGQSSSFSYKNRPEDLRNIGEALGVNYILEGSVRRSADSVRIEAQLVHAADGFLVWSDVFEDSVQDIFIVQEKIANSIGSALKTPLGVNARALQTERTDNPAAYDLFVKGLAALQRRGSGVEEASDLLVRAVTLDPNFAAGWAALSLVYDVFPAYDNDVRRQPELAQAYYRQARDAALSAERLDPELPIVRHALGNMFRRDRDWEKAEDMYRAALETQPDDYALVEDYSELLATMGQHSRAVDMIENILAGDPLNSLYIFRLAELRWLAEQSEQNMENLIVMFQRRPEFQFSALREIIGYLFKTEQFNRLIGLIQGCYHCNSDLRDEALALVTAAQEQAPEAVFESYKDSNLLSYQLLEAIGGPDLVLQAFRHDVMTPNLRTLMYTVPWTALEGVGKTEEFKFLVVEERLLEYWLSRGWPDRCRPLEGDDFECG